MYLTKTIFEMKIDEIQVSLLNMLHDTNALLYIFDQIMTLTRNSNENQYQYLILPQCLKLNVYTFSFERESQDLKKVQYKKSIQFMSYSTKLHKKRLRLACFPYQRKICQWCFRQIAHPMNNANTTVQACDQASNPWANATLVKFRP